MIIKQNTMAPYDNLVVVYFSEELGSSFPRSKTKNDLIDLFESYFGKIKHESVTYNSTQEKRIAFLYFEKSDVAQNILEKAKINKNKIKLDEYQFTIKPYKGRDEIDESNIKAIGECKSELNKSEESKIEAKCENKNEKKPKVKLDSMPVKSKLFTSDLVSNEINKPRCFIYIDGNNLAVT